MVLHCQDKTVVEPIPTELIAYADGLISGSYLILDLPTISPSIILSDVCLHHSTGLNRISLLVIPGPLYKLVLTESVCINSSYNSGILSHPIFCPSLGSFLSC